MTDISFYHLTSSPLEAALPRLLEKVIASGKRAVILAASEEKMETLNSVIWTYSTKTFLPHGSRNDEFPAEQPIYLTTEEENPNGADILVVTEGMEPQFMAGFERCLDLFDGSNESETQKARQRWSRYKQEQHMLSYWQQNAKGGWEKK